MKKFLIIEDDPEDRELIVRLLQKEFSDSEFVNVFRQRDFDEAITRYNFDAVITEYRLGWTDGLRLLKRIKERLPYTPVIMVTHTRSEEIVVEGMKSGLSDFILKKYPHLLPATVKESIEKTKLLKMYDERNQKYNSLMNNAVEAISIMDVNGNLLEANKKAECFTEYTKEELIRLNFIQLFPKEKRKKVFAAFKEWIERGSGSISNVQIQRKDGKKVPVDITGSVIEYSGKKRDSGNHQRYH